MAVGAFRAGGTAIVIGVISPCIIAAEASGSPVGGIFSGVELADGLSCCDDAGEAMLLGREEVRSRSMLCSTFCLNFCEALLKNRLIADILSS